MKFIVYIKSCVYIIPFVVVFSALSCVDLNGGDTNADSCNSYNEETCFSIASCEAIPYLGESFAPCNFDERYFSDNCPYQGCRELGAPCPTLDDLQQNCDSVCSNNSYKIDGSSGCHTCECL